MIIIFIALARGLRILDWMDYYKKSHTVTTHQDNDNLTPTDNAPVSGLASKLNDLVAEFQDISFNLANH